MSRKEGQPVEKPQGELRQFNSLKDLGLPPLPPVILKTRRWGPMTPERWAQHQVAVQAAHDRRIDRLAKKAFGETPEEQRVNLESALYDHNGSYAILARTLKEDYKVRLGKLALRKLHEKLEKDKEITITIDMVVNAYLESNSIRKTADALHCGEGTVRNTLRAAGVKIKSAGRPPRVKPS